MNRLIRIAGGTASGKTTIAQKAALHLKCLLLQHDRYYVDIVRTEGFNFDEPAAMDNQLLVANIDNLINNKTALLPRYDFHTHSRQTERELCHPQSLIILEGILVMACDELDHYSSLDVYVDAPADIRFIRRLKRDTTERGRSIQSITEQYINTVRPMHEKHIEPSKDKADLLLDGTKPIEESVQRLIRTIRNL